MSRRALAVVVLAVAVGCGAPAPAPPAPTRAPTTAAASAPTLPAEPAACAESFAAVGATLDAHDAFYAAPDSAPALAAYLAAIDAEQAAHGPAYRAGCRGVDSPEDAWLGYWDALREAARDEHRATR